MTSHVEKVLKQAIQLPEKDRVRVVEELLASLEPEPDEDVEASWAVEIERRTQELEAGGVKALPWEEVKAQAKRRVSGEG